MPFSLRDALRRARWNVAVVSAGFVLLFMAYNTLQNFVTSLLPGTLAEESLGVMYGVTALVVPVAPRIIPLLGPRVSLVLGAAGFVLYMVALVTEHATVILAAAAVMGIADAILWVAWGYVLNASAALDATFGRMVGAFWFVFQLFGSLGNLGTYFVFQQMTESAGLFIMFASVGAAGCLVLLLLRRIIRVEDLRAGPGPDAAGAAAAAAGAYSSPKDSGEPLLGYDSDASFGSPPDPRHARASADSPPDSPALPAATERAPIFWGARRRLGSSCRAPRCCHCWADCKAWRGYAQTMCLTFQDWRLLALAPLFFVTGYHLGFWSGSFPLLVRPKTVGLVLAFVGVGDALGGAVLGPLGDRLSRAGVLAGGALAMGGALALASLLAVDPCAVHACPAEPGALFVRDAPVAAIAAALLFGLADAAFNTQSYALIGDLFEARSAPGAPGRSPARVSDPRSGSHDTGAPGRWETRRSRNTVVAQSLHANAFLQFFQNVGSGVGFFLGAPLPLPGTRHSGHDPSLAQVWILAALVVPAVAGPLVVELSEVWAGRMRRPWCRCCRCCRAQGAARRRPPGPRSRQPSGLSLPGVSGRVGGSEAWGDAAYYGDWGHGEDG